MNKVLIIASIVMNICSIAGMVAKRDEFNEKAFWSIIAIPILLLMGCVVFLVMGFK